MTTKLSPTMVARYNVARSKELLMENVIIRTNIACEMEELRMANASRLKRSRDRLRWSR